MVIREQQWRGFFAGDGVCHRPREVRRRHTLGKRNEASFHRDLTYMTPTHNYPDFACTPVPKKVLKSHLATPQSQEANYGTFA